MLVDGKAIAADILREVAREVQARPQGAPRLAAITCAPNFETRKYLEMKRAKAASVGIELIVVELPETATTEEVVATVTEVVKDAAGVVVQLPLPEQVDVATVIAAVPATKDPDGFRYGQDPQACLSPVVGAIDEISKRHQIEWEGKHVVVLGEGRLVGRPAAAYAAAKKAEVTVLTRDTYDPTLLQSAEIVVSGIGQPRFITPDLVSEGVVIFDAGTSEDGGQLVGDASSAVADKAALVTPVPGGIGPITIAYLLKNLLILTAKEDT